MVLSLSLGEMSLESKALLEVIALSAEKTGDLAQQLLAFAGGGKYQPQKMIPNAALAEMLGSSRCSFPSEIMLKLDLAPNLGLPH